MTIEVKFNRIVAALIVVTAAFAAGAWIGESKPTAILRCPAESNGIALRDSVQNGMILVCNYPIWAHRSGAK